MLWQRIPFRRDVGLEDVHAKRTLLDWRLFHKSPT